MKALLRYLLTAPKTVFSFKELLIVSGMSVNNLKAKLNYYVKRGYLYHIRRGFYAKDKNYNHFELAVKIFTPAYISFETVLVQAGIVFQYYSEIFVASYTTRSITCDGQVYTFRSLKSTILTNTIGVEIQENYSIASPERAFLDVLYLSKAYHFDNLSPINWDKVNEILPVYGNKRMENMVEMYRSSLKNM
jgi:predicted transcriptional regulator of viral defense system